jgi:hypothetical protein
MEQYSSDYSVIFEFPILYWSDIIKHNDFVPFKLSGEYLIQSIKNIMRVDKTFYYNEKKILDS